MTLNDGWRICDFCECQTNARLRQCCIKGWLADGGREDSPWIKGVLVDNRERKLFYTLGNPKSYEHGLLEAEMEKEPLLKLGRTQGYPGGCVFKTIKSAEKFNNDNNFKYKVYGLKLSNSWNDIDFSKEKEVGYGFLLTDSEIIRLEDER